jgi:NADPH:quinone reductase-like Zn-dependent oxidoreductase
VGGIGLGKYVLLNAILRRVVLQRDGAEAAAHVPIVSAKLLGLFWHYLPRLLSPFDALWVVLAVLTAWRLPKGIGIKPPPQVISE